MFSLAIRFAMNVDTTAGVLACWPWRGATNEHGYGLISVNGRPDRAHRVAMRLNGVDVDGVDVLHECDNPPCCNPAHLFTGTQADNVADCIAKDRHNRGERNGSAKLTDDVVRAIRARRLEGADYTTLAHEFSVGRATACRIVNRKAWAHVR